MLKKPYFLLLLVVLTMNCKNTTDTPQVTATAVNSTIDSLTIALDSIVSNGPIVGLAAAILKNDTVRYNQGFGYANVSDSIPYSHQTIQNIGSISKTFIGIALFKAQELGKLQLDDPVNKFIPFQVSNPKYKNTPITLRQLATHTSSIIDTDWYGKSYVTLSAQYPETTKVLDYFSGPESSMSMSDYLKNVLTPQGSMYEPETFSEMAPGTDAEYTNLGATLAALAI